jgi:serine/threonine protein kinase
MEAGTDAIELAPGTKLGHYVIMGKIADGGMGTVYRAHEPALERYVAIKILHDTFANDPQYRAQFLEEAKSVAALRHANIVPLYFVGQEQGLSFFAMALIEGQTLDDMINERGLLDHDSAMWFLTQAIAALEYAARYNIIHLDIKPSNFMVDKDNIIMLTDFGLARRKKDDASSGEQELMGTPYYCSPEHILQQEPDIRTDIYCLGATLFHLMGGHPVYEADSIEEVCRMQVYDPFPQQKALDSGIPFGWACLMHRMMEKSPAFRFQNYAELGEALANVENYRYGKGVICLPPVPRKRALPRYAATPETLFGIMPPDFNSMGDDPYEIRDIFPGDVVYQKLHQRLKSLSLNVILEDIEQLCDPVEGELYDLVSSMEKHAVIASTINELTEFIQKVGKVTADDNTAKIEIVGLGRARRLAITGLMLEKPWHCQRPLDWRGLWQHSICVGLVVEMMYDMLGLESCGAEYACGLFHDIGKILFAEMFPSSYPGVILKSLGHDSPLNEIEIETFGMDHAQIAELWLSGHKGNRVLSTVVCNHDSPDDAEPPEPTGSLLKAMLGTKKVDTILLAHAVASANHLVKELGLGFSGNTYIRECDWANLESTRYLFESRAEDSIDWEDFKEFFAWSCHHLPDFSMAGYGAPPAPEVPMTL